MKHAIGLLNWILPLLILVHATSACSPKTRVGYVGSEMRMGPVRLADGGPGTTGGNPAIVIEDYDLSKDAPLKYVGMCLDIDDKLEFTTSNNSDRRVNALERVPRVDLPNAVMAIKVWGLPAGIYTRITVPINDGCGGSPAIGVVNSFGPFSTNHAMDLEFEGTLVPPSSSESSAVTILLDIRKFVVELSKVSSAAKDPVTERTPLEVAIEDNRGQIISSEP